MAKSKSLNVNGKRVSLNYDDPDMPPIVSNPRATGFSSHSRQ